MDGCSFQCCPLDLSGLRFRTSFLAASVLPVTVSPDPFHLPVVPNKVLQLMNLKQHGIDQPRNKIRAPTPWWYLRETACEDLSSREQLGGFWVFIVMSEASPDTLPKATIFY